MHTHTAELNRSLGQVAVTPGDSNEFMTCEEKGYVRLYDLRVKSECLCDGCKKVGERWGLAFWLLYCFFLGTTFSFVHGREGGRRERGKGGGKEGGGRREGGSSKCTHAVDLVDFTVILFSVFTGTQKP